MVIQQSVIDEILQTVGALPPETGGILGCGGNHVVSHFAFDRQGAGRSYQYTPCVNYLNDVIHKEWGLCGISFCGMVHSHPNGKRTLSKGDLIYAEKIIGCFEHLSSLLLLLVTQAEEAPVITYYEVSVQNGTCIATKILPENKLQEEN